MNEHPIPYSDDVEQLQPHEARDISRCIDSLHRTNALTFDRLRHGYRATHAKSHGILRGQLVVQDGLPPELAQGLFTEPATYPVVVRIATETGQLDDDRKPNARGLSARSLLWVWWRCSHGHEWEQAIAGRTDTRPRWKRQHAAACPYCAGHRR